MDRIISSNQITEGMMLSINNKAHHVEAVVKVKEKKSYIKTKLKDMTTGEIIEKEFPLHTQVQEITSDKHDLMDLYWKGRFNAQF